MEHILIILLSITIIFGLFISVRNEKVYQFRKCLINFVFHSEPKEDWTKRHDWFESLSTYNIMVWKFWVWPLNKFLRGSFKESYEKWKDD